MLKFSRFCTQTAEILLKFSSFFLSSDNMQAGFTKSEKSNSTSSGSELGEGIVLYPMLQTLLEQEQRPEFKVRFVISKMGDVT